MASDSSVVPSINLELEELLRKLVDFGNALLDPPASDTELLQLLEEFELFLSGISQGEAKLLSPSLRPSKKALIGNQLLRHADADIQVTVLSCIIEITRITADEWPYEPSEMKEFFLLLTQSLKRLSSMNDHCYAKVMSILETMAGTRSCVIMLDLDMEGSILEMFRDFLSSIQSRPSPALFSDMVTVMTTVLQELCEEGIPVDLLTALLTSVKKDRKDVSPISWAMGVQILQNSARHIRPFLANAVQSLEIDLNDYTEIVASICQNTAEVENMTGQELASDSAGPNAQLVDGLNTSVDKNSTAGDIDNSIPRPQFGNQINELTGNATNEKDDGPLKDENSLKDLNSGPTKEKKIADLKAISEAENVNVTAPKEHNHGAQDKDHDIHDISSEQNASKTLEFGNQTTSSPLADNATGRRKDVSPLRNENSPKEQTSGVIEVQKAIDFETISEPENVDVNNAVPPEKNDGVKVPEKRERKPNSLFGLEEGYRFAGRTGETGYPKSSCGWKNNKRKINWLSDRKSNAVSFGNKSAHDEKPCRKRTSKKKGYIVNQHGPEQKQLSLPSPLVCGKRSGGKSAGPANCDQELVLETSSQFDIVLASLLTNKPASESEHEGKSSSSKEEASRMTYGEKLVGCKIKVWWPMDQEYYEGSVDSFDLSTMKHKVIYDDGDEEVLNLMGEDWKLVNGSTLLDGQENVICPASSDLKFSDGPSNKKRKENSNGEDILEVDKASAEQVES